MVLSSMAQTTGNTCAQQGGLCAPIAGCNFVDGAFALTTPACGSTGVIGSVCCVPEAICGVSDKICCGAGSAADFVPMCDRGTFSCTEFPGTLLLPIADCTP